MNLKHLKKFNENFKHVKVDDDISDMVSDWKKLDINGVEYDFMRLNEKIFVIELDGVGEIGRASLNDYDELHTN